jgi:hypothetical protein
MLTAIRTVLAAWTCFFCKQDATGNTCANCGV